MGIGENGEIKNGLIYMRTDSEQRSVDRVFDCNFRRKLNVLADFRYFQKAPIERISEHFSKCQIGFIRIKSNKNKKKIRKFQMAL